MDGSRGQGLLTLLVLAGLLLLVSSYQFPLRSAGLLAAGGPGGLDSGDGLGGPEDGPPPFPVVDPTPLLLSGYAWSGGAGWISFGNGDYYSPDEGVYLGTPEGSIGSQVRYLGNQTGDGPGYAWSSNLGWIKFNKDINSLLATGESGPPVAGSDYGARLPVTTSLANFTGWARACAVFGTDSCSGDLLPELERGGWDGWIRMSGEVVDGGGNPTGNYDSYADSGIAPTKFVTSAHSWGGDVIGWIKWCSGQSPYYCVRFGGLGATCSVSPDPLNFASDEDGSSHHATWRVNATNVPTFPCPGDPLATCVGQHTYDWDIDGVGIGSARANAAFYEVPQALYQCPDDHGQTKQGNFTVTNTSGTTAYCSLSRMVTCVPPGAGSPGGLSNPDVSTIRISSQPLASPAISSAVRFSNTGTADDSTVDVEIISSASLVVPSVSLADNFAGVVGCRMAMSDDLVTPSTSSSEFHVCNNNTSLPLGPGGEAVFNIRVGGNPSPSLNQNSPYQITVRATAASCPEETVCEPVTKSFLFDYAVGSVKPI